MILLKMVLSNLYLLYTILFGNLKFNYFPFLTTTAARWLGYEVSRKSIKVTLIVII
jgi:hypothetical protein